MRASAKLRIVLSSNSNYSWLFCITADRSDGNRLDQRVYKFGGGCGIRIGKKKERQTEHEQCTLFSRMNPVWYQHWVLTVRLVVRSLYSTVRVVMFNTFDVMIPHGLICPRKTYRASPKSTPPHNFCIYFSLLSYFADKNLPNCSLFISSSTY